MTQSQPAFISKLRLLNEPRLALFDADGTLWENDIADDCTIWMIGTGRIHSEATWAEYRSIYSQDPPAGCRYLLRFFKGLSRMQLNEHVEAYWREFMKLQYIEEPVAVLKYLKTLGFQIWVVTGSPTDFLLPLPRMLPVDRVVGMDFEFDRDDIVTGRHSGISCAGPGKAEKICSLWNGPIQFAAGNALLDEAMLRLARDVAWAVHPHPELERIALAEGWSIKASPCPPYGTSGWASLEDELRMRGLPVKTVEDKS